MEQANPYPSLSALRQTHRQLLSRRRDGVDASFLTGVETFIRRGCATGVLLEADDDRWEAQNLLDYWANELLHNNRHATEATLAEFDPIQIPDLPDDRCPYLGLDAFSHRDHAFFFGRDALITAMVDTLKDGRFLAITGPSGSGKSSIALAGLLPDLQSGILPESNRWRYLPAIRPGVTPLNSLARLVAPAATGTAVADTVTRLQEDPHYLAQQLNRHSDTPSVILIDQFEELFTLTHDDDVRRSFIANVTNLVTTAPQRHIVIITMRSDLEYHLVRFPTFQTLYTRNQIRLTAMTAAELRDAIEKPAALVGLKFEEGLVDELVRDILGEPSALPLLQFTLRELWERRHKNRITWEAYRHLGGGRQTLAHSADTLYNSLSPTDQHIARQMLLRIVRPGQGTAVNRDRVLRRTLHDIEADENQIDRVLAQFVDARLLRLIHGQEPAVDQVEIAHEALVTNWPRLAGWLDEARVSQRQRVQLAGMAEQWEALGRDPGALLRGRLLADAQQYTDLSEIEQAYVDASAQEAQREALAQQKARRQRLRQAEQLADERKQRLEDTQRLTRRLIGALAALGVVFVIAVIAGLLAVRNANTARQNEATAVASEMTAVANERIAANSQATAVVDANQRATAEAAARSERDAADSARATAEASALDAENARATAVAGARETEIQFRLATARELAAAALGQLNSNPQLGLLLALESVYVTLDADVSPPVKATDTLFRALQASQLQRTLSGHTDWVTDVAISPDGTRIASAGLDRAVRLWDIETGQALYTLSAPDDVVNGVDFSPDGTQVAAAVADGLVLVWNVADGELLHALAGEDDGGANAVAFHPDGTRLAAVYDNAIRLWDVPARQSLLRLFGHEAPANDVAFHPDGEQFATAGADGRIILWEAATGTPIVSLDGPTGETTVGVNAVAYRPDGMQLAAADDDGTVRIWQDQAVTQTLPAHVGTVFDVAYSSNGRLLATAGSDGTAKVWQVESGRLAYPIGGHSGGVTAVQFAPDDFLATASQDNTVKVWNVAPGIAPVILSGHEAPLRDVAVSADGRFIATASEDESIILWDAHSGQPVETFVGHFQPVTAVAFSPDGALLASGSEGTNARLWSLRDGDVRLLPHPAAVRDVAFAPDGALLATAGDDGVRLWDVAQTQVITRLGHTEPVTAVAFHPDGNLLASGTTDGTVQLWQPAEAASLRRLTDPSGPINDLAFSPDGTRLAAAGNDGLVTIWSLDAGTQRTLRGHTGPVLGVAFHPSQPWLATAGADRTVKLWHVGTGQALRTWPGHSSTVTAVAFSPDEEHIISASVDRTAQINTLASATALFALAWQQAEMPLSAAACAQYLRGLPCVTIDIPGPLPSAIAPINP